MTFPSTWTDADDLRDAGFRVPVYSSNFGVCREYRGYWICIEYIEDDPEDARWSSWWWTAQVPGSGVDSYSGDYEGAVADGSVSLSEMDALRDASDYTRTPHEIIKQVAMEAVDKLGGLQTKKLKARLLR